MRIVKARAGWAGELTRVAFAAKAFWGYPGSWMARWAKILTITAPYLEGHPTYVARSGARIAGFYSMAIGGRRVSLEHFWVLPQFMGRGVGRLMFRHFERRAREAGALRIAIESDPNAEGFYRRMGATRYSRRPARMDDRERFLPLLTKPLRRPGAPGPTRGASR